MAQPPTPGPSPQSHNQPGSTSQRTMEPFRLEKTSQISQGGHGGFSYSPSLLAQLSSALLLLGWVSGSSQNTALAFLSATTRGGVWPGFFQGRQQRFLPTAAPGPARPAAGFGPRSGWRVAPCRARGHGLRRQTAAPVMSGRFQLPKHGCESGAAFPPVFGWSGTSRDRRRLSRLPAIADALGLAVLSRHSRGSLPHAVTASISLGSGASLEAWQRSVLCWMSPRPLMPAACIS